MEILRTFLIYNERNFGEINIFYERFSIITLNNMTDKKIYDYTFSINYVAVYNAFIFSNFQIFDTDNR